MKVQTQFGKAKVVKVPPRTARRKGMFFNHANDVWYEVWRCDGKLFLVRYVHRPG